MNPTCPTHGTPLTAGRGGGWFCPKKMPDGQWCPQKVAAPKPAPNPQPAQKVDPGASSGPSDATLQAAALNFAAQLFRGAGPEMADDAIALAIKAYSAMKAVS